MPYNIEKIIIELKTIVSNLDNLDLLIEKNTVFWKNFTDLYAADIADVLENIDKKKIYKIFKLLNPELKADVFMEFSNERRKEIFLSCNSEERESLLEKLEISELVDFFDDLSDLEVKKYIKLLNKKEREKVLSLLEFPETSAAGIMDSNVFVLSEEMTVEKTVKLLQRLNPDKSLYKTIYVVNPKKILVGKINIEDLVINKPNTKILEFIKDVKYKVLMTLDQEEIATHMMRYHVDILPVIDEKGTFLGVITGKILAQVLEHELSEDILRMASLGKFEQSYFETSTKNLLIQRGGILTLLLLLQSISTIIIGKYQYILAEFLITYIGVITSTGGNSSSQVSALIIQGFANGDISSNHFLKFMKKEIKISFLLGLFLAFVAFLRIYLTTGKNFESGIIAFSLFIVVIVSTILGSITPFILRKISIDPAYSAGPLLATCMDIIGVIIFTLISFKFIKI